MWNYFSRANNVPAVEENEPIRALPASWYSSQEMYDLERRAIFNRRWLLTTHKLRLAQAGDWLRFDIASHQFIICRDREGNINAFHNICRHRAFPVVTEDKGTARIFSCRYHGWSYGLNGKLAKAPGYQELDNFDKSKNGLLPIHVHVDDSGFIWVNFDGTTKPEVAWEKDFGTVETQDRMSDYDFENYQFDHTWDTDVPCNWKILADHYNESYPGSTAGSDPSTIAVSETSSVITKGACIMHDVEEVSDIEIASTFFLPNASMNAAPHFFFIRRFVPLTPTTTSLRYEVYRHKDATDEQFNYIKQMFERVSEDRTLCTQAQENVSAGVVINGEMHPTFEKGSLYFQKFIRDNVTAHHKKEQEAKQEIWPSRQQLPNVGGGLISQEDIEFCSGLACSTNQPALVW